MTKAKDELRKAFDIFVASDCPDGMTPEDYFFDFVLKQRATAQLDLLTRLEAQSWYMYELSVANTASGFRYTKIRATPLTVLQSERALIEKRMM